MEDKKPIIQELEDGRIIKYTNKSFTELVDGKWVEPIADFTVGDFIDGKRPSLDKLKGAI